MRACQSSNVDDLTQIMWAGDEKELAAKAYDAAKEWAIVVRENAV